MLPIAKKGPARPCLGTLQKRARGPSRARPRLTTPAHARAWPSTPVRARPRRSAHVCARPC
eukprot:6739595-Lingulodinium_polyedra.AAC.1